MNSNVKFSYKFGVVLAILQTLYYLFIHLNYTNHWLDFPEAAASLNSISTFLFFLFILIYTTIKNRGRFWKIDSSDWSIFIVLLCISAYSFNYVFSVFQQFSTITTIILFTILIPIAISPWKNEFPNGVKYLLAFLSGVGLIYSFYFAIYLIPLYAACAIGIIILGIGLHGFIPIILFIRYLRDFKNKYVSSQEKWLYSSGVILPLIILLVFLMKWSVVDQNISSAYQKKNTNLPTWIRIAQTTENNWYNRTYLTGAQYYETPDFGDFFKFPRMRMRREKRHDPMIYTAFGLFGKTSLAWKDREKILNNLYLSDHSTEEKLWDDNDLRTISEKSKIDLFPEYRMSYTEKELEIKNLRTKGWGGRQEAHYSFYLPEGAVVSSLSLWVEGKERKARLTTKGKADSAYKNIVGVQRRDPAIAHWREGNRVVVRIFPCTPSEVRKFKIGVSAPMSIDKNQLVYNEIYYDGPATMRLVKKQNITVIASQNIKPTFSYKLIQKSENEYYRSGIDLAPLNIHIQSTSISTTPFCFDGKCFQLSQAKKEWQKHDLQNIYLDINAAWDIEEYDEILSQFKNEKVFVFTDQMVEVSNANKQEVFKQLSALRFSIFPFYSITSEKDIIITKSVFETPNFDDLKNTDFAKESSEFLQNMEGKFKVVSLNKSSGFWSTLNQLQIADVHRLKDNELSRISKGFFPSKSDSPNKVYLNTSNSMISIIDNNSPSTKAPDHLFRLFYYNQVLKKIGKHYFQRSDLEQDLSHISAKAHILTPVSSLIVLETNKDYDDHGIKANNKSLGNASSSSSGAVPEPHEWLIILTVLSIILFMYRSKLNRLIPFK